jgi:hypothetical protein
LRASWAPSKGGGEQMSVQLLQAGPLEAAAYVAQAAKLGGGAHGAQLALLDERVLHAQTVVLRSQYGLVEGDVVCEPWELGAVYGDVAG